MSLKKGFNYDNVKEFCERYNCKLLTSREYIDDKPDKFEIESSCGHISMTSFSKLFKKKTGVYCDDCFNNMDKAKCFKCGEIFEHTKKSFVFCSTLCIHSHKITNEQKQKVRDTFYKKLDYYDENGMLMNQENVRKLKLHRKTQRLRASGVQEAKRYTYKMIKEIYEKESCELITTEDEFIEDKLCRIFKIKGKCGCVIERSNFNLFLYEKIGINCITCTNKNTSINAKNKSKIDGIVTTTIIEKMVSI